MYATGVIIILVAVLYVLFWIAVSAGIVYLFILIVKALKKYVNSKDCLLYTSPSPRDTR